MKNIAQNRKAFAEYDILDRIEAGIVLTGDEVKSIRSGNVSLQGAFATMKDGELFLINCNISAYNKAFAQQAKDYATRSRKLLLHKKEVMRLIGDISRKGVTIIPLQMYFNKKNIAKVELGIGKHKKAANRKAELKERDIQREARKEIRGKW